MHNLFRENSRLLIEQMQKHGVVLIYNEKSVSWLNDYITHIKYDFSEETIDKLVMIFGSFLGECMRLNYGGEWLVMHEQWSIGFTKEFYVFPFYKVSKHFDSDHESILEFYQRIPLVIQNKSISRHKINSKILIH
jgi:hypothetical protein